MPLQLLLPDRLFAHHSPFCISPAGSRLLCHVTCVCPHVPVHICVQAFLPFMLVFSLLFTGVYFVFGDASGSGHPNMMHTWRSFGTHGYLDHPGMTRHRVWSVTACCKIRGAPSGSGTPPSPPHRSWRSVG